VNANVYRIYGRKVCGGCLLVFFGGGCTGGVGELPLELGVWSCSGRLVPRGLRSILKLIAIRRRTWSLRYGICYWCCVWADHVRKFYCQMAQLRWCDHVRSLERPICLKSSGAPQVRKPKSPSHLGSSIWGFRVIQLLL